MNHMKQIKLINRSGQFTVVLFMVLSFLFSAVGCSNVSQVAVERESSNIKRIAIVYGKYIRENRGRPPATEDAFKKFLTLNSKAFGVDNADEILVSERDNEPYKILYGKKLPKTASGDLYVACETTGLDGLRFAATSLGKVEEVEADKLSSLLKSD